MNGLPMLRKSVDARLPTLVYHPPTKPRGTPTIAMVTAMVGMQRSQVADHGAVSAGPELLQPALVSIAAEESPALRPDSLPVASSSAGDSALASSIGPPTKPAQPSKRRLPRGREMQPVDGHENAEGVAKPLGRPRKLVGKVRKLLLQALRLGYSRNKAAELCGIAASTITREFQLDAELARRVADEESFGKVFKEVYDLLYFPGRVVREAQPVMCCPQFEVEKQVLIAGGLNAEEVRCYRLASPREARRYRKTARRGRSTNPELFEKGGRLAITQGATRKLDKA